VHIAKRVAAFGLQGFEDVGAALPAAIQGQHGIEPGTAVGVEAHPIIREHRIGGDGFAAVLEDFHPHTRGLQRGAEGIELGERAGLDLGTGRGVFLEAVGRGGLGIGAEVGRPDHQHGGCALLFGRRGHEGLQSWDGAHLTPKARRRPRAYV
jgi:hypothetical protein